MRHAKPNHFVDQSRFAILKTVLIATLLAPSFSTTCAQSQSSTNDAVSITPDPKITAQLVHDFGYIPSGSTHRTEFKFQNPTDRPIHIKRIRVECGCTKLKQKSRTIPANSTVRWPLTFDAPDMTAHYTKRIFLETDHPDAPMLTLQVKARLGLPLAIEPNMLDLGSIPPDQTVQSHIILINDSGQPVKLLYSTSKAVGHFAKAPRKSAPATGQLKIPIQITSQASTKVQIQTSITLHTNHPTQPTLVVPIRYSIAE